MIVFVNIKSKILIILDMIVTKRINHLYIVHKIFMFYLFFIYKDSLSSANKNADTIETEIKAFCVKFFRDFISCKQKLQGIAPYSVMDQRLC